jgi:hypothetical protein
MMPAARSIRSRPSAPVAVPFASSAADTTRTVHEEGAGECSRDVHHVPVQTAGQFHQHVSGKLGGIERRQTTPSRAAGNCRAAWSVSADNPQRRRIGPRNDGGLDARPPCRSQEHKPEPEASNAERSSGQPPGTSGPGCSGLPRSRRGRHCRGASRMSSLRRTGPGPCLGCSAGTWPARAGRLTSSQADQLPSTGLASRRSRRAFPALEA